MPLTNMFFLIMQLRQVHARHDTEKFNQFHNAMTIHTRNVTTGCVTFIMQLRQIYSRNGTDKFIRSYSAIMTGFTLRMEITTNFTLLSRLRQGLHHFTVRWPMCLHPIFECMWLKRFSLLCLHNGAVCFITGPCAYYARIGRHSSTCSLRPPA